MPSLKMNKKQLQILQEALDMYLRANLGQLEHVMDPLLKYGFKDWDGKEVAYTDMHELTEEIGCSKSHIRLGPSASHGVYSKYVSNAGHMAYDMIQVVQKYLHEVNPESNPDTAREIMPVLKEPLLEVTEDET